MFDYSKVAVFFLAFLPQFVVPGAGPASAQLFLHGSLIIVVATLIEPPLVVLGGKLAGWLESSPRAGQLMDRTLGSLFIALGGNIANIVVRMYDGAFDQVAAFDHWCTRGLRMGSKSKYFSWRAGIISMLLPLLLPTSAQADVTLRNSVEGNVYILVQGEIVSGFYDDFLKAAYQAHQRGLSGSLDVVVSSPGGDVAEAMRIGVAMRELRLPISLPVTHLLEQDSKCYSACLFLWAGAVDRVGGGNFIGIHRPRFDRSYYSGLTSTEASKKYRQLISHTQEYLKYMGIRTDLIEYMYQIPADEMYVLSLEEVQQFGLNDATPAYDEWLSAKCARLTRQESEDWMKLKTFGERAGFSKGYAEYLLRKDKQEFACTGKAGWEDRREAADLFFKNYKEPKSD